MKLIVQIPCFNEAEQIADTLAAIPKTVAGISIVETLVIDDGSEDGTASVALAAGADHVVRVARNQGLAKTFMTGIEACLERGADIIVNCDADNQYDASAIPALVEPIIERGAGLVVGERPIAEIAHFSPLKRKLQHLGSWRSGAPLVSTSEMRRQAFVRLIVKPHCRSMCSQITRTRWKR